MPFKQLKALGRLFILFLMLSVSLGGVCVKMIHRKVVDEGVLIVSFASLKVVWVKGKWTNKYTDNHCR